MHGRVRHEKKPVLFRFPWNAAEQYRTVTECRAAMKARKIERKKGKSIIFPFNRTILCSKKLKD